MDANTNIEQTDLTEVIMSQPWCLSIEHSTTPNKVILITTLANISVARTWVDDTLPAIYRQHISTQLDVTTLQQIVPHHLDKPILTSASCTYASKLKQRTDEATVTPMPHQPLNCPPKSKIVKPADITFAEAAAKNTPNATQTLKLQDTAKPATAAAIKMETFD